VNASVHCPDCGSDNTEPVNYTADRTAIVESCRSCGSQFSVPEEAVAPAPGSIGQQDPYDITLWEVFRGSWLCATLLEIEFIVLVAIR
jgi:predicted RNA-binding Zn-ribbon protein involved in translation (DUF1610 family)